LNAVYLAIAGRLLLTGPGVQAGAGFARSASPVRECCNPPWAIEWRALHHMVKLSQVIELGGSCNAYESCDEDSRSKTALADQERHSADDGAKVRLTTQIWTIQ